MKFCNTFVNHAFTNSIERLEKLIDFSLKLEFCCRILRRHKIVAPRASEICH